MNFRFRFVIISHGEAKKKTKSLHHNEQIKELSDKQKEIKLQIHNHPNHQNNDELKRKRNRILTEIHNLIQQQQNERVKKQLTDIESKKDDSTRMFVAIKEIQRIKPKQKLLINTKDGKLTASDDEQTKIIAEHFKSQFYKQGKTTTSITPTPMRQPFTGTEIHKAVTRLRNNKSPGIDDIKAEMLKNAPSIIMEEIASILNETAETGNYPSEIVEGIIAAIQKPGKKKGPPENLRPITLLSMIRKIMAICVRNRIINRIDKFIPPSQAAYRSGRSTTEHVFSTKIIAEQSISSTDQTMYLLMLDMSKAFDTVNRSTLINELSNVIEKDELHLVNVMLNTKLRVRCGNALSEPFSTNTGVPQGDSLSANQFTFYLARTLADQPIPHNDHNYTSYTNDLNKQIQKEHSYYKPPSTKYLDINQEYADDMSIIATSKIPIQKSKMILPQKLKTNDLMMNEAKTEEYEIKRNGDENWKECKFLGSMLDTTNDIKRRKSLALTAIENLKSIFYSKINTKLKMRAFNCYIGSIFLYNSELWTLTSKLENGIDSFHRRLLRLAVLNIKWPNKISNAQVYVITEANPWSKVVKKRQLSWFGHLMRLSDDTPAKLALSHALHHHITRPRGRQATTWITMMSKRMEDYGSDWKKATTLAQDRAAWNEFIKSHS